MNTNSRIGVHSEIGDLEAVILHQPGPEVENMTPLNAERALYSDILNLSVARKEYAQLSGILKKYAKTYFVEDLLRDILENDKVKEELVRRICKNECTASINEDLLQLDASGLSVQLIEGVPIRRDSLTNYLSQDNFSLRPLHNFFFTRDSAVTVYDRVLISTMASRVRERESLIMEAIFNNHPELAAITMSPSSYNSYQTTSSLEGGDILIARDDIILVGIGARSTSQGIDFLLDRLKEDGRRQHIIVQELPQKPESFIHLDMVFTLLDRNTAMIYEPLILKPNRYQTVHITLDNGKVSSIHGVKNIPEVLKTLGMPLDLCFCGGRKDSTMQEREQWHSGANFLALAPGKVISYSRNVHTLEDLNKNGFEILRAKDILAEKTKTEDYDKYVISFDGSELSRGGGGARCMTMPVKRKML